jgi:uncharacterized protein YecE (DUF72 family)
MVDYLFLGPQTNQNSNVAVVSATIRKGRAIPMHDRQLWTQVGTPLLMRKKKKPFLSPKKQEQEIALTEFLVGAGGWSYFQVPGEDSLSAYAKAFNFVEINSTFYEYPETGTVRSWRKRTPRTFQFSVRCHRDVTYRNGMEPSDANMASLERMLDICEILQANILHIQIPRGTRFDDDKIKKVHDLLHSVGLGRVRIAVEISGLGRSLDPRMITVMQDLNLIHCVNLSQTEPAYKSDILYTRLFGPTGNNVYQFSDEELREIDTKASGPEFEKSILAFHGVKMYKDAARLKVFKDTREFPMVTPNEGLESLREVLSEDCTFPTSSVDLIKRQGWKVIDLTSERRIRAAIVLEKLPNRQYFSVGDVITTLGDLE